MATERDTRHVNRESFYRRERQSIPAARAFAAAALVDWGIDGERADDVTLCVSELATNALLHGVPPGRGFRLHLNHADGVLRVEVHDSGGGWPRCGGIEDDDDADESGRGLLLVAALTDKWGVTERDPGKIVWFEINTGVSSRAFPPARARTRGSAFAPLGEQVSRAAGDQPGKRPATS
ncbi:ATP-binding protein [Streptomyces sp. NPDC018029]|uniref:ATP-binding protein n=1 Tax=Streptomyces sp. NPDC018029 TaxID=3365032 RepID=UPI0037878523